MLKVYLENEAALVFEDSKGEKCAVPPSVVFIGDKIISVGNKVRILIQVGGIRLDEYLHYSGIEVSGVIYSSATETVAAITKLCSVFKPGGGDGTGSQTGVTITDLESAITTHNTDENAHEYLKLYIDSKHPVVVSNMSISNAIFNSSNPLVPNTFYEFGFLTSLQINQIPKSFLPVVIWFKCISKTTLILPSDILFEGDIPDKDGDYELSIMNGLAFCKLWNYPYEE
jgi:hypothetical protein